MRPVTTDGIAAAAEVLATTFADDDFYRWLCPDPSGLGGYFEHKVRGAVERDEAFTSDSGRTVMVVEHLPNDEDTDSVAVLADVVGTAQVGRIRTVFAAIHDLHPSAPHTYLDVIATAADVRGTGEGTALMRDWLARVDALGETAYLQSSSDQNLSFYTRLGFVADAPVSLPHGAGRLTPMRRAHR